MHTKQSFPHSLALTARTLFASLLLLFCCLVSTQLCMAETNPSLSQQGWRLRIFDAAVVHTPTVYLKDIAEPLGLSPAEWERIANTALWPAPEQEGKPLQINRQRLQDALRERLGNLADTCILPSSLAIQKGGSVMREEDLRALAVKTLTPTLNTLGGRANLVDFRLPAYAFLAHPGQQIILEPASVIPGRLNLKFAVQEMDGSVIRRFTGTVMLELWMDVPCVNRPLNKGDALYPQDIIFMSKNMANIRGEVWDGRGGPWQILRPLAPEQPVLISDIGPLAAIRKGSKVTLVYQKGNVQIRTMVEALEDGGPGDTIAVRNMESKKTLYGVVVDPNTVMTK